MILISVLNVIVAVYCFVKNSNRDYLGLTYAICHYVILSLSLVSFGRDTAISVLVLTFVVLTSLLFVKLNTSVIVFYGQDIDILNGE